jgi:hypothetical protein
VKNVFIQLIIKVVLPIIYLLKDIIVRKNLPMFALVVKDTKQNRDYGNTKYPVKNIMNKFLRMKL